VEPVRLALLLNNRFRDGAVPSGQVPRSIFLKGVLIMTIAAIIPAIEAVGALATLASSVVSAITGAPRASAQFGSTGAYKGFEQMEGLLKRQQDSQLKTMEIQSEANIQKMWADTANSIASGRLDSGNKAQNAVHKAAQGIHF
jgi:hypothetical protein